MFKYIDLFAGIGGFHIASDKYGGQCVAFSEIAKDAIEYYCKNHNILENKNLGDITKIKELNIDFDFMTAGVPCQSWSIAGKRLGFDDDRGQLWNDTLYILNHKRPKAFLFENVKGLTDEHNREAFNYVLERIKDAGYYATWKVINSYDYGSPQMRERVYIIGFREKKFFDKYLFPEPTKDKLTLSEVLTGVKKETHGFKAASRSMSINETGENDYYLFNDTRNGTTTVHTWDLYDTTDKEKNICLLMLKNRRKAIFGPQDGNPLSLKQLQSLDKSITQADVDGLLNKQILRKVDYLYEIVAEPTTPTEAESIILYLIKKGICVNVMKWDKNLKKLRINPVSILKLLEENKYIKVSEVRYEFKNSKISTGINGINRIILRSSNIFPTLVASDTNDYVATVDLSINDKEHFINEIYKHGNYRKLSKEEACLIQGYPKDFILPENRQRWMKLIGNSVTVPVIEKLVKSIVDTDVFKE